MSVTTTLPEEQDDLWAAFGAMESWFAMASSPDGRVFARSWTDGRGGGATSVLDLDSGHETHWSTSGAVVALVCAGPDAWAALAVTDDDPIEISLDVRHGDRARTIGLTGDRWVLVSAGGERFAAVPQYGEGSQALLVGPDGHEWLDLGELLVTSVAGAFGDRLYVNARSGVDDVRLAAVDLHDGRVEWSEPGTLGVLADGPWMVTTTTAAPDRASLVHLGGQDEEVDIALTEHRGDVSVRAVAPDGTRILMGVHRGFDDACVLLDVATGRWQRLNDSDTSFGLACFFSRDVPHWVQSSPGGSPALLRRSQDGSSRVLLGGRSLGWTDRTEVIRLRTDDPAHEIEALVIHPAPTRAVDVVVVCLHGGPRSRWSRKYDQLHQLLVGAGATVVAPNTRGSSSDDRSFERALRGRWGDADRSDLDLVAQWVAANHAGSRRVVLGQSYGGYLAFQGLLTHPAAWDAAVLASGFTRPEELVAHGPDTTRSSLLSQQAVPSRWAGGGSEQRCDGLRTWVVHGRTDSVVPVEFGVAVHDRLVALGASSRLTVVDGAGHQPFAGNEWLHLELAAFVREVAQDGDGTG